MRTCGIIPLQDVNEWRNALCTVPHAIAHTWEHCYAMHLTSGLQTFLYHFTNGDTRIICAFAERQFDGTTDIVSPPGFAGFVGTGWDPAALECWSQMMSERDYVCGYVALHPSLSEPGWFAHGLHAYSTAYTLDLTLPASEIYSNMSESQRRVLQRADRDGCRVWAGTPDVKGFFVRHFSETYHRRNAGPVYRLSDATIRFLSSSENILFIGAGRREVESVTAIGFTAHASDALYNVSFSAQSSFSTLLIWTAIERLQALGIPALNLGTGMFPLDGLRRYKLSLGAAERPLHCLKQVYDCERFASLCSRAGVDAAGYFPPYRAGLGKG